MSGETESVYGLRVLRVVTGTTGRHLRRDLGATAWGVSFEQGLLQTVRGSQVFRRFVLCSDVSGCFIFRGFIADNLRFPCL